MCVVSYIMDNGYKELDEYLYRNKPYEFTPMPMEPIGIDTGFKPDIIVKPIMTLEEWVAYFENLIILAKEFDIETGQPECEDVVKKMAINKIAKELGITIKL